MPLLKKRKHKENGFTLIELLLYIGTSATMLLVLSLFITNIYQSRAKNQTIAEVEQQGLLVMKIISQTIHNAESITSPAIGISSDTAIIDVITPANDPTIFNLSNNIIQIQEGLNAVIPLTSNRVIASSLDFQNLSRANTPGLLQVNFTLTHINTESKFEYDYTKTFTTSISLR